MAVTNNAVQFGAGLLCTLLTDPAVGAIQTSGLVGYDPAKSAMDSYVNVGVAATPLHSALTISSDEYGMLRVSNPNTVAVTLLVDGTPDVTLGIIPPGTSTSPSSVLIPIGNGVVINATVAASTATVGVTVILCSKNTA